MLPAAPGIGPASDGTAAAIEAEQNPVKKFGKLLGPGFIVAFLFAVSACAAPSDPAPTRTDDLVMSGSAVSAAVNKYFYYRRLAVVARDAEILWSRFPELRTGEDLTAGINTEGWTATRSASARTLVDVVYSLEGYDRMRMRVSGDEVVVRVHGLERYVAADFSDGTAGEFIIDLYLRRNGAGWTVVKTDEMTLAEFHDDKVRH